MGNGLVQRGVLQTVDVTTPGNATLSERMQSVLRRLEDRPGDAPVVVSVGFLRWIAEASAEKTSNNNVAELHNQIKRLTHELDDARESAAEMKARSDRVIEQLQLADIRSASLTKRVAKLRATMAAVVRKQSTAAK